MLQNNNSSFREIADICNLKYQYDELSNKYKNKLNKNLTLDVANNLLKKHFDDFPVDVNFSLNHISRHFIKTANSIINNKSKFFSMEKVDG